MAKRIDITADYARQLLDYNPETGILTWKARTPDMFKDGKRFSAATNCKKWNTRNAGQAAGFASPDGYRMVSFFSKHLHAASLVWLLQFGVWPIDGLRFVSEDISDLRISNLREPYADDEIRQRAAKAASRWREKPGNSEKHRESVKRCRQRPHAKEAHRVRALKRASENREGERKRAAEWRAANPERERESRRQSYLRNIEKRKAAAAEWRKKNPETVREFQINRRGRKLQGGKLSKGIIKKLFASQAGLCRACEADLEKSGYHLDHVVALAKGGIHEDGNVQLLCPTCNRRKQTRSFDEFLEILKKENDERTSVPEASSGSAQWIGTVPDRS